MDHQILQQGPWTCGLGNEQSRSGDLTGRQDFRVGDVVFGAESVNSSPFSAV
jgi:hypothetical protein